MGKRIGTTCKACKGRIIIDLRSYPSPDPELNIQKYEKTCHSASSCRTTALNRKRPKNMALRYGILRSMSDLPAMPHVVSKAQGVISSPDSSVKDLVKIIEVEQSISARVLKIANSTYYGLSGRVSSVQHASTLLGYKVLGEVIAVAGISNVIGKNLNGYNLESGDMWQHSMAVAVGSRLIANKRNPELGNDAFFAGLMHDAGKLVLDPYVNERKEDFEAFLQNDLGTFLNAEQEILGFDHSEIAADFCDKWNIPDDQGLAIKYHHYPSQSQGNALAYILHMADFISRISGIGTSINNDSYQLEDGAMEFIGFQEDDIGLLQEEILAAVEDMITEIQH